MGYSNWTLRIAFLYSLFIICIRSEITNTAFPAKTNFSCLGKSAGFYADIDANCKIYHTCDEYGNKFTYRCPEETAFRQDALICDHAHLVDCKGSISSHIEENKKKHDNFSCVKESVDNTQSEFNHQPVQVTQPIKPNKIQYGFAFSSRQFLKNLNETEVPKNKIIKSIHPLQHQFNSTTDVSVNNFTNIKAQYVSFVNQNESDFRKDGNSFIQSSVDKDKFNEKERTNQKDTVHNFWKFSLNTLSGNTQSQQDNMKKNQTTKNSRDSPKLSFMNHRNYPYLETLKSIQKNTKISSITSTTASTTSSTTAGTTASTTASTTANTFPTTTEIPVYALTLSLKPLLPTELEYDPYYPKFSTSTESYYTPTHNNREQSRTKVSTQTSWSNTHLKLPSILPDLNSLEDIVDRRKLFYIPRIKFD